MYFILKVCSQCSDISGAMGPQARGGGGGGTGHRGVVVVVGLNSRFALQVVRHPKEYSAVK